MEELIARPVDNVSHAMTSAEANCLATLRVLRILVSVTNVLKRLVVLAMARYWPFSSSPSRSNVSMGCQAVPSVQTALRS